MALSRAGFQSQVQTVPVAGVEGDFHTLNPPFFFPAGPGGLVAGTSLAVNGAAGILVGRFCWTQATYLDPDNAPTTVNNWGSGQPIGILTRRQQGLNTVFLQEASMLLPTGLMANGIASAADLWVINRGTTTALIGQNAYANFLDGGVTFGTAVTGGASSSSTGSLAPATWSTIAGSISGNVMTITGTVTGTIAIGSSLTTSLTSGTVVSQSSGTPGGIGVYTLSVGEQAFASAALAGAYTLFTAGTVTLGSFAVNNVIGGTGTTSGSVVTQILTGSGGTGSTMAVTPSGQTNSGNVITVTALNTATYWYAQSSGGPGELVKVSRLPPLAA